MVVLIERVVVERELGSGHGDIITRIPNSNHTWSSGIGSDVAWLSIGSDQWCSQDFSLVGHTSWNGTLHINNYPFPP